MISISAVSYNGDRVAPLAARFDEAGGSIGRADGNRLVLPDPDRTISRVHAEIVHRGGGAFAIINRSSNAIVLNGRPIDNGAEAALAAADELHIGAYVLQVGAAVASAAPAFADDTVPGGIPDDWDPFAVDAAPSSAATPVAASSPAVPAAPAAFVTTGGDDSIDALFGLSSAPAAPPAAPAVAAAPVADYAAPAGSVLSWNLASGDSTTTLGTPSAAVAATAPPERDAVDLFIADEATTLVGRKPEPAAAAPRSAPPLATPAWRPPGGVASTTPPATTSPPSSSDVAALALAWRESLGAEGLPPEALQLTPELMRLLGRLLREATRGTIDLLAARAALKREIRAEVTMIVARENNPLKFSASADVALAHLLGSPERGFMPGDHAMRDAYEDLRAHQFATLAGMRAALEGIFTRFDPAVLEGKLTQKSLVDAILPSARKARMWDLFNEMYGQIAAEASDDFHELFGKAFLRAYEEHIGQLEKDRP